jgi:AraC-like DNA-binding protein
VLGYVAATSACLEDALERIVRYFRLLGDPVEYELSHDGDEARWRSRRPWHTGPIPAPVAHFDVAVNVCSIRNNVGDAFTPRRAHLPHRAPDDPSELSRVLRCPIAFESDWIGFTFDASWLSAPMKQRDPALCQLLETLAGQTLEALPAPSELDRRVRRAVLAELDSGNPTLDAVAKRLGIGTRSLQRRLGEQGTTLSAVVDDLRAGMAKRYLTSTELTLDEIAFALSFHDRASFSRAFKRWTGTTPGAFRSS